MISLPALALAAVAFAVEPAALNLQPAAKLPPAYAVFSADFSLAARASDKSINVWRTSDGKQVARLDAPLAPPALSGSDEYQGFNVTGFSPDGRRLAVVRDQRVKMTDGTWSVNEKTVFVMDVQGGAARPLVSRRKGCRILDNLQGVAPVLCPSAQAEFFPDGRRLAIADNGFSEDSLHAARSKRTVQLETLVVDLSGKAELDAAGTATEASFGGEPMPDVFSGTPGAGTVTVDAQGRLLGLIADESGCEVKDLASGKHVSFLDGCTNAAQVHFQDDGLAVSDRDQSLSRQKGTTKAWDLASGDLLFTSTATHVFVGRARNADAAYVFYGDEKRFEARDRRFGRLIGTGALPTEVFSAPTVSPDGALVAVSEFSPEGTTLYRTGVRAKAVVAAAPIVAAAAPPVPAAPQVPSIDVDAPPAVKLNKVDPDAYAVVIGVERYRQPGIPAVDYASRDARTVYSYLTQSMGFDTRNVMLLTDENATRTDFEKNLGRWLQNRAGPKSRVFVYYAGHGAPNPVTGEGYLMPYEADPNYVEDTAFPVAKLYAELGKLPTKDVTVVLDACFSGQGGRSLIAKGARPLVTVKSIRAQGNTVVLAAASASQISAADPDRRHGLLTEYLLEALHGAADARGDGRITADEIYAYVRPSVERAARLQNVEQTPTMAPVPSPGGRPWIVLK